MKKSFKLLIAFVLLVAGSAAFAQWGPCMLAPQVMGQPQRCYDGRIIGNGVVPSQYVAQPVYAGMPQYYNNGVPVYNQQPYYNAPVGGGLSTPTIVGGVLGATVGSLAKHHTGQAVIGGTILGGIIGSLFSSNGGQRIAQSAPIAYQQPVVIGGQTIPAEQQVGGITPVNTVRATVGQVTFCSVKAVTNGNEARKTIRVASPADCEGLGELVEGVRSQGAPSSSSTTAGKPKLEESTLPSGGEQDTCRLRVNGKSVAEIKLPLSVKKEEAKQICDEWQAREAKNRGLV